jgi:hypothetical protein
VDLCDLVRAVELPFAATEGKPGLAGQYSGLQWHPSTDPVELMRHYLGDPDPAYLYQGRTQILGCECGEPGCWPLVCCIRATGKRVYWSDFAQPQRSGRRPRPWHSGQWRYTSFGPFTFQRAHYEEALLVALRGTA